MARNVNKEDVLISKEIKINNMSIKVVKKNVSKTQLLEAGIISAEDADMDCRAREAVNMAKKSAKICKKPIAVYDLKTHEAKLIPST